MNRKLTALLLTMTIALGLSVGLPTPASAADTEVLVLPQHQEFGPAPCIGTLFSITVEIHEVTDLYGFDIQFGWDSEWIEYVNHTKMIPVEQYPEGILHAPTIPVKDQVDETASIPGSEPGTMYWLAEASMVPAEPFEGNGVCFRMTFRIKKQPALDEPDATVILDIISCPATSTSGLIPMIWRDGEVVIHALAMRGPGDLNYDGEVDILDLQLGISTYGRRVSELGWIPEADEAPPYGVIDMLDLVTICSHYGNHYP